MPSKGRLIIVSNRLPVSIKDTGHGQYEMKPSSGGLVTGLRGLANNGVDFLWFGWPGLEIPKENVSKLKTSLSKKYNAVPVLLDRHTAELYYNGFSSEDVIAQTRIA
jgi:trehalose 6-phosphate synthase